jgi:hypothetical protein
MTGDSDLRPTYCTAHADMSWILKVTCRWILTVQIAAILNQTVAMFAMIVGRSNKLAASSTVHTVQYYLLNLVHCKFKFIAVTKGELK